MASLTELAAAKGKTIENKALAAVRIQQIHYTKLHPSEKNFYSQERIEEMADSIAMAGIIQPLIVRKVDMGEYEVIVGHRRRLGSILNVERGIKECEFIPCIEVKATDKVVQEIKAMSDMSDAEAFEKYIAYILIASNSTGRQETDYEKMIAAMELKELIPFMRGDSEMKGRALRAEIAKEMKCSSGTIGTYEAIYNNLVPEGHEKFSDGEIGVSTAYKVSRLDPEEQRELLQQDKITDADVKGVKERRAKDDSKGEVHMAAEEQTKEPVAAVPEETEYMREDVERLFKTYSEQAEHLGGFDKGSRVHIKSVIIRDALECFLKNGGKRC